METVELALIGKQQRVSESRPRRTGRAVRSGAAHSGVHVADREEASERPDAVALEAVGVTRAVEALVVRADRLGEPGGIGEECRDHP